MTVENPAPGNLDVADFIRNCVERAGGAVEPAPEARLDVLLPPELEPAAGGRSWVRLALSAGGLEDHEQPAMLGSPFLDALIAFAAGHGTVASGYLPAGRLKTRGLREVVERNLLFSNCRTRYEGDEADVMLSATAQFDFKVVFLSAERRERVYVVPVDLFSNQVRALLVERLARWGVASERTGSFPESPLVPIDAAYAVACGALRRMVAVDAVRQQVRVAQRFAVELARTSDYYGKAISELERRRTRERLRRARDDHRPPGSNLGSNSVLTAATEPNAPDTTAAAALERKIEAAQRERENKLRELGETYGMRVRARLSSARCLWQPKAFFKVLIDRGSTTRALVLAYDGLFERLDLPVCESCRRETHRLWASPSARLLCPACAAERTVVKEGTDPDRLGGIASRSSPSPPEPDRADTL